MAFHVRDQRTDALVREVARLRGEGITETIKSVFDAELERQKAKIQDEIASWGKTGLVADKAFFDDMWGQGDG